MVLLAAAAVVFGIVVGTSQRSLPGPLHPRGDAAAAPRVPPAARSLPVSLSIPAIGLTVPLSQLGLNPDGTIQVPPELPRGMGAIPVVTEASVAVDGPR